MHRSAAIVAILMLAYLLTATGCTDLGDVVRFAPDGNDTTDDTTGDTTTPKPKTSFRDSVMPIFQASCAGAGCHIPGPDPIARLSMKDYATLIGDDIVIPGDAQNSKIIRRLDGRLSPRMPFGRLPLPDSVIQIVRRWIDQGALNN